MPASQKQDLLNKVSKGRQSCKPALFQNYHFSIWPPPWLSPTHLKNKEKMRVRVRGFHLIDWFPHTYCFLVPLWTAGYYSDCWRKYWTPHWTPSPSGSGWGWGRGQQKGWPRISHPLPGVYNKEICHDQWLSLIITVTKISTILFHSHNSFLFVCVQYIQ